MLDHKALLHTIDRFPGLLFVVDQAYARYSVMPVLTDSEVLEKKECDSAEFADQTICHAGLRIGYAVGARDIIERNSGKSECLGQ